MVPSNKNHIKMKNNSYNVRKLMASEIEIKPCQIAKDKTWVQVLLYKTSRVDMQVLTEMYGNKWKSSYQMVGDSLFCTISVYDSELNEWISRCDCGEKDAGISEEKSYATSAFKRAATQFGIGMELYSTPRITFNTKDKWFGNDGKLKMTFSVSNIEWDGDTLTKLVIADKWGNVVYNYTKDNAVQAAPEAVQTSNERIPSGLYAKVCNAPDIDTLKALWADNTEYHNNLNFKKLMGKRKAALNAV